MPKLPFTSTRRRTRRPGFTLIETALAIVIIGVGVLAMTEAQQTFLRTNAWSTHTSTATFLANEIREMSRNFPRHDAFSGGIYFENPVAHTTFRGWGPETDELVALDYDDFDDLDGVMFGSAANAPGPILRTLPGPINAFRAVISDTSWTGNEVIDADTNLAVPLAGWSQYVMVSKVDPTDYTAVLAADYYEAAVGMVPEVRVNKFPLRVTVVVLHQDDVDDAEAREISRVTWVVPP